jgi:hypothetical protein
MIYRAAWEGPFELYDSTAAFMYRDYGTESGVQYHYKISVKNILDLESPAAGPVTALPMALDRGILYCNLNRYDLASPPAYPRRFLDRLYESAASAVPMTILNVDDGEIPFKRLADFSLIIIDESNVPKVLSMEEDTLENYLRGGGKAVIIKPAFESIGPFVKVQAFGEGSFYHDFLKLDSAVTNAFVIQPSGILGDLYACEPLPPEYPWLYADTVKLAEALIPIDKFIPLAGYLFPDDEAESIYNYLSANPDTVHHGRVNGIRYLGRDYQFVLFSFPLMAMQEPASFAALRQALVDLGVNMGCGDANDDDRVNIGDIITLVAYLYRDGPEPAHPAHSDIDCNGEINMADALGLINYIFREGRVECCP